MGSSKFIDLFFKGVACSDLDTLDVLEDFNEVLDFSKDVESDGKG